MKLIEGLPGRRTHVIADRRTCYVFCEGEDFERIQSDFTKYFGVDASSAANAIEICLERRPDLLVGLFRPDLRTLTMADAGVSLDPRTSAVVKSIFPLLNIDRVRRVMLAGGGFRFDEWFYDKKDLLGVIPSSLFHGTSTAKFNRIKREGLRKNMPSTHAVGDKISISFAATPQIAAFHGRKTAEDDGSLPLVIECQKMRYLRTDWDVQNKVSNNSDHIKISAFQMTKEAGLFAVRRNMSPLCIIAAYEPAVSVRFGEWRRVFANNFWRRSLGSLLR